MIEPTVADLLAFEAWPDEMQAIARAALSAEIEEELAEEPGYDDGVRHGREVERDEANEEYEGVARALRQIEREREAAQRAWDGVFAELDGTVLGVSGGQGPDSPPRVPATLDGHLSDLHNRLEKMYELIEDFPTELSAAGEVSRG